MVEGFVGAQQRADSIREKCAREREHSGGAELKEYPMAERGVPEAVSQLTTPVTALCYNLMLAKLVGDIGVSTFSVLSFIYSLANAILSGVAQGLQPLWGNCCGKRDTDGMNEYFRWGRRINVILSSAIYGLLLFFTESVIRIFNQDPELVQNASTALPLFSLSFIPMALNLIYTAFLYSTKRTLQADAISFSRGVVLKAAAIACPFGRRYDLACPTRCGNADASAGTAAFQNVKSHRQKD